MKCEDTNLNFYFSYTMVVSSLKIIALDLRRVFV